MTSPLKFRQQKLEYHKARALGTSIVLVFINDLPFALKKAHATLYADDTTFCYSSENMEDLNAVVNSEFLRLNRWLRGNKLSLNIMTTRAMIIGAKQKLSHMKKSFYVIPSFKIETEYIDLVNQTKYHGLMADDNLSWDSEIKNI